MQRLEQQVGVPLMRKQGRHKSLTDAGRQLLRHARQMLALNDEALAGLRQDGPSGVLRIGSPHDIADTILTVARKRKSDLIVMGSHGRRGLEKLMLGSVAQKVLGVVRVPVMVVRD